MKKNENERKLETKKDDSKCPNKIEEAAKNDQD